MKLLREPLLHFLVLGVAIFGIYGWLGDEAARDEIVVTRGQQINLIDSFEQAWQRPPTADELAALVQDHLRQEIAYREGQKLALDRDDIVIRRRLQQKLELLTEDLASLAPPTEAELDAFFAANAERFRSEPRFSFEQIYFSESRRGESAAADATALLTDIASGAVPADAAALGDPIALPSAMRDAPELEITATFGPEFAEALAGLSIGRWAGPVRSGFGLHLVRLEARVESRIPARSEVAQAVASEFLTERRALAVDALYRELARNYSIRIESLTDAAAGAGADAGAAAAAGAADTAPR